MKEKTSPSSSYLPFFRPTSSPGRRPPSPRRRTHPALRGLWPPNRLQTLLLLAAFVFLVNFFRPNPWPLPPLHREGWARDAAWAKELRANKTLMRDGQFLRMEISKNNGLNNQLQEIIFHQVASTRAGFSYVYYPYTWRQNWLPFVISRSTPWLSSRIPLSSYVDVRHLASLGGPPPVPNALFESICPRRKRKMLRVRSYTSLDGPAEEFSNDGKERLKGIVEWIKREGAGERCVEVVGEPFDYLFSGQIGVVSALDDLKSEPSVHSFTWGAEIVDVVRSALPLLSSTPSLSSVPTTIPHLLTMHLRRGDFEEHCRNLAIYRAQYYSWNLLPSLPDRYEPMHPWSGGDERLNHTNLHCYPTIDQVVARASELRSASSASQRLQRVYVLSNGDEEWKKELRAGLSIDGWEAVVFVEDLYSTDRARLEMRELQVGVDMDIASRAEVFVGNGFSSLTANVNLFRLADDAKPLNATRFL